MALSTFYRKLMCRRSYFGVFSAARGGAFLVRMLLFLMPLFLKIWRTLYAVKRFVWNLTLAKAALCLSVRVAIS